MRVHSLAKGLRGGIRQAQPLPGADPDENPKSHLEATELPQESEG